MKMVAMAAALLATACGPRSLTLPDEPLDRAATCGAVTAAAERGAAGVGAPLSLEALGRVLHYPLLAGSEGEAYASDRAAAVQERMTELQDSVAEGKWQDLIPACQAAFPATAIETISLPDDRFQAQLECDELSDFLRSTVDQQQEYENELAEYRRLSNELEPALVTGLRSRAGSDSGRQQEERRKALAEIAKAGPPVAVLRQCVARFG